MSSKNSINAGRIAAAVYNIAKGAATGGPYGAAAGAAKSFLPEIIKAAVIIISVALLLPALIFAALPNILFGYDNAKAADIIDWTKKAYSIDAAYKEVQNYTLEEIDRIVEETKSRYESSEYDEVEVNTDTDNTNIYWFIAISSVAHKQDLFAMDENSIRNLTVRKIISSASVISVSSGDSEEETTKKLQIDIKDMDPEELMDDLGFTEEERNWAKVLFTTLDGSGPQLEALSSRSGQQGSYNGYQVPKEYLVDVRFAAMIKEAEKYLGYPYVFGGSTPSGGFDCSGFVCWVINKSGAGNVGRVTAQGLYYLCTPVSRDDAKPGDLVFFENTYTSHERITHVGLYVGDGMMINAGNPIQYDSIDSPWRVNNFCGFARLPQG